MILVWLLADHIPATDLAGDAAIWLGLVLSGVALLAAGRRIFTGLLAREEQQMKPQLTDLAKAVSQLAESVGRLITEVEVIKDRQKRIAEKIEVNDERRD